MQKGFEFRFENLLIFKAKKEEEAKMVLSCAVKELDQENQKCRKLEMQYEEAVIRWNEVVKQQQRVAEMKLKSNQIQWLADLIKLQRNKVQKAEEKLEKCRLLLVEAKKETRKFEKIREKDFDTFRQAEQKLETASVDQFVSHRNAHK